MRISRQIIDLENAANAAMLHILDTVLPRIAEFDRTIQKADGTATKAFQDFVPRDIELPTGMNGTWSCRVQRGVVTLSVKIHGDAGFPNPATGDDSTYYAERSRDVAYITEGKPDWKTHDEIQPEQFEKQYDFGLMKSRFEEAQQLEDHAKALRREFAQITSSPQTYFN